MSTTDAARLFNSMELDAAKRPSGRLSPEQIERAAEALRDYELQPCMGVVKWERLNEKIKQHFRGKVRVVVDAVGEA